MADFDISERAKEIAAAAIEGKFGALDLDDGYDDPEGNKYGFSLPKLSSSMRNKILIVGGVATIVAAVLGGALYMYDKKKKQEKKQ